MGVWWSRRVRAAAGRGPRARAVGIEDDGPEWCLKACGNGKGSAGSPRWSHPPAKGRHGRCRTGSRPRRSREAAGDVAPPDGSGEPASRAVGGLPAPVTLPGCIEDVPGLVGRVGGTDANPQVGIGEDPGEGIRHEHAEPRIADRPGDERRWSEGGLSVSRRRIPSRFSRRRESSTRSTGCAGPGSAPARPGGGGSGLKDADQGVCRGVEPRHTCAHCRPTQSAGPAPSVTDAEWPWPLPSSHSRWTEVPGLRAATIERKESADVTG